MDGAGVVGTGYGGTTTDAQGLDIRIDDRELASGSTIAAAAADAAAAQGDISAPGSAIIAAPSATNGAAAEVTAIITGTAIIAVSSATTGSATIAGTVRCTAASTTTAIKRQPTIAGITIITPGKGNQEAALECPVRAAVQGPAGGVASVKTEVFKESTPTGARPYASAGCSC